MQKPYIHPTIKNIQLDPSQTILQVCKAGGVYIFSLISSPYCSTNTGAGPVCNYSPKGGIGNESSMDPVGCDNPDTLPS